MNLNCVATIQLKGMESGIGKITSVPLLSFIYPLYPCREVPSNVIYDGKEVTNRQPLFMVLYLLIFLFGKRVSRIKST